MIDDATIPDSLTPIRLYSVYANISGICEIPKEAIRAIIGSSSVRATQAQVISKCSYAYALWHARPVRDYIARDRAPDSRRIRGTVIASASPAVIPYLREFFCSEDLSFTEWT